MNLNPNVSTKSIKNFALKKLLKKKKIISLFLNGSLSFNIKNVKEVLMTWSAHHNVSYFITRVYQGVRNRREI